MRPEIRILFSLGRSKAIAPQQYILGEIGEFGASDRVDKITRSGDGEAEAELLSRCLRHDPVILGPSRQPWSGKMETEIRKSHHPFDGIGGRGRARSAKPDRLMPANRIGQLGVVVVSTRIAADTADRQ
jgi:hypothetical protein